MKNIIMICLSVISINVFSQTNKIINISDLLNTGKPCPRCCVPWDPDPCCVSICKTNLQNKVIIK